MEVNGLKKKNSFLDDMCVNPMNMPLQVLMHQVLHMEKQYMNRLMQPIDLKHGQAAILFVLWKKGPVSQRELADMMQLKPPSITAACTSKNNGSAKAPGSFVRSRTAMRSTV